jgi:predicted transcriptional regulator
MTKSAKIAITIPPEDLAAADRLAAKLGRSRSWVLSEALRRFVQHERLSHELDASRSTQLRRDLALTAAQRVREGEALGDVVSWPAASETMTRVDEPRRFATYDEFDAWRRAQRERQARG